MIAIASFNRSLIVTWIKKYLNINLNIGVGLKLSPAPPPPTRSLISRKTIVAPCDKALRSIEM